MPLFHYRAITADGKPVTGQMEAADARQVITALRSTGHLPVSSEPASSRLDFAEFWRRLSRWRGRIKRSDVTSLTRELATLLNAGLPLDAGLKILARQTAEGGPLRALLKRVHDDVQAGKPLSSALAPHVETFDPFYVNLVRAGEAGGSLAEVMQRLAAHRERSDAFRATVIASLTYPAVLVGVAATSLFVLTTFVIPRFIPLFAEAGDTLPLLTAIVFAVSNETRRWWWALVLAALAVKLAVDRWLALPGSRLRRDGWLLRAPLVGEVLLFSETVRFARTLETLLRNGLPLLAALELVKNVQRNAVVAGVIESTIAGVRSGGKLAAGLSSGGVLPELAVELVTIGEESGHVEEMLEKVAETFEGRAQQKLKRLLTLLEPALILGLGAVIAIVIVSILMAMLGLTDLVA
jgi:general secretion pathway protein F